MDGLLALRAAHLIGAAVLFGTGAGIAFFMLMAHRTKDAAIIARTAQVVVVADFVFTTTAVVLQPVTGVALAWKVGWALTEPWIVLSLGLYVLTGTLWLPVVWIQMRIRDSARATAEAGAPLPRRYAQLFRIWCGCGVPAFLFVLGIFALMIGKTQLL